MKLRSPYGPGTGRWLFRFTPRSASPEAELYTEGPGSPLPTPHLT